MWEGGLGTNILKKDEKNIKIQNELNKAKCTIQCKMSP